MQASCPVSRLNEPSKPVTVPRAGSSFTRMAAPMISSRVRASVTFPFTTAASAARLPPKANQAGNTYLAIDIKDMFTRF